MSPSTYILTETPWGKDEVSLGSLLVDLRYPNQDAKKGDTLKEGEDFSVSVDRNFSGIFEVQSHSLLRALISSLWSMVWKSDNDSSFAVTADEGRTYILLQPRDLFYKLCCREDYKKWIEKYMRGGSLFFVVGIRTLLNAKLIRKDHSSSSASATAETIATQPERDEFQVGAEARQSRDTTSMVMSEPVGERIFALCYRRVTVKIHKGETEALLEKSNCWEPFLKNRGAVEVGNVIEADIEDSDFEEDMCEGMITKDGTKLGYLVPDD